MKYQNRKDNEQLKTEKPRSSVLVLGAVVAFSDHRRRELHEHSAVVVVFCHIRRCPVADIVRDTLNNIAPLNGKDDFVVKCCAVRQLDNDGKTHTLSVRVTRRSCSDCKLIAVLLCDNPNLPFSGKPFPTSGAPSIRRRRRAVVIRVDDVRVDNNVLAACLGDRDVAAVLFQNAQRRTLPLTQTYCITQFRPAAMLASNEAGMSTPTMLESE